MKRGLITVTAAVQLILYGCGNVLTVNVENPADFDRHPEMVELSLEDVSDRLDIKTGETFSISSKFKEVPYQITWDKKVIFPIELKAGKSQTFKLRKGNPEEVTVKVRGDHYPHRVDDICWENDKVGYRVYGFKEDKASGYDIFTKKNTDLPVIPEFYRKAFDPEMRRIYSEMKKVNKDSADIFNNENMSFHVDHGYGADFYAVGPTLGAGTSALLDGEDIIYPFCWDSYEILDNGPIRFTIKLTFRPFSIGDCENVVETRTISLDLGTHFNRTDIQFAGLDKTTPIVSGIVVQDQDEKSVGDASKGYIAYPAPTMNFCRHKEVDNGTIFIGHVYPESLDKTALTYFSDEESKTRGGAKGHMLAHSQYDPARGFTYYWGFAWNKADMETYEEWIGHVDKFSRQLRTPLTVNIK